MHRRLLPLIAITTAACSTSSSPIAAQDDAGDDGGPACTFSCGPTTLPEELDASLAVRVRARLDMCNAAEGCHVSGPAGLTYPPGNEFANVIDVRSTERPELFRVKPGDPSASYLYMKVLGDGGIDGGRMPLNATTYDPRIPQTIFAWIEAGAPQQ